MQKMFYLLAFYYTQNIFYKQNVQGIYILILNLTLIFTDLN